MKTITIGALVSFIAITGCDKRDPLKEQGFNPEPYTPPTTTSTRVETSTEVVDLGGLTVEMPSDVQRRKMSQVVNATKIEMWEFKTILSTETYISGVFDYSLNPGYTWDYKKGLDGGVEGGLKEYQTSGYNYKIKSDKYVTVAGRPGRTVIFTSRFGLQTYTGRLMALVEKTSPRCYLFVTLTKEDLDEKALRMFLSIK